MKCPKCEGEMEQTIQFGAPIGGWHCDSCNKDYDDAGEEV